MYKDCHVLLRFCDPAISGGLIKFHIRHKHLKIWAQFYKVKQTQWNICIFTHIKENVNMVNLIFQLFYVILQQAPSLH